MKNYKVLLCDYEEDFVVALMNYVNRNSNIPVLTMAFTDVKQLVDYFHTHKADLLVVNAVWKEDLILKSVSSVPMLWVLDGEKPEQKEGTDSNYISKYTPAPAYSRRMLQILSEQSACMHREGSGICMAVYSPIGRCGKTRLSHALCKAQVVSTEVLNGSCVYVGMEEYGEPEQEQHEMETLLYYVKQRTTNLSMKMKSLATEEQGYDVLVSSLTYQELRELHKDEMQWLLDSIRKEGCYDLLVADIGSGSFTSLELLAEFDVLYLPYLQDENSRRKVQAFCQGLKQYGLWEGISDMCYPVLLEDRNVSAEEARLLEERRRRGDLNTLKGFAGIP